MTLKLICWAESMSSDLKFSELCCGLKVGARDERSEVKFQSFVQLEKPTNTFLPGFLIGNSIKYLELEWITTKENRKPCGWCFYSLIQHLFEFLSQTDM